jgi:hypothetical protein
VGAVGEFGHDHDSLGLAAAADGEGAGERPAFDPYGEVHAEGCLLKSEVLASWEHI